MDARKDLEEPSAARCQHDQKVERVREPWKSESFAMSRVRFLKRFPPLYKRCDV